MYQWLQEQYDNGLNVSATNPHVLNSDLVSPERQEESSTNVTELLPAAELSQPKTAYFVGYSIHRLDKKSSHTQIAEARLSEHMSKTAENFQTPISGTSTDSAAADATSPHPESEKDFPAASTTTLKDLPTNPVTEKTRAPSGGTHSHCNASRDRCTIDCIELSSRTSGKVQRTVSISDSDAVAQFPLSNDDGSSRPRSIQTCPRIPLFETRSISSPARAARSDTFLAEELVVFPKLIELQASKQMQSDGPRAALEVATSLFSLNPSRQLTLGDDTPVSLPWQQPLPLRNQTNVENADKMQMHGIGNIQALREIDVQGHTPTKMRFNPCPDSPVLNPPMLQPRVSSGYALKQEVDEMLKMARPLAVNYYRFGSPKPINYFLTPTPIKIPEAGCHSSTPRQPEPPGILRKANAHDADWTLPPFSPKHHEHPPNTAQSDLQVDLPQATEDEFFLQTPQALRDHTFTSRVGKRLKTLDFDDIVHIADDDFMCLDLLEAFSE